MIRILFLCRRSGPYILQMWRELKKNYDDLSLNILALESAADELQAELNPDDNEHIYTFRNINSFWNIYSTIKNLPEFDIIQALWIQSPWYFFPKLLRSKTKVLYLEVGGSDLYRSANKWIKRFFQKRIISYADIISSENEQTRDYFYQRYGEWTRKIPHRIIRFGVDVIDEINSIDKTDKSLLREKWNIPSDKCVVMLGHSGQPAHQHSRIMRALGHIDRRTIARCFFIVPMTYGTPNEDYRRSVEDSVKKFTCQYLFLDDYLNKTEMAEIAIVSDVMIHVQTTDQLSSTMMSHLYCGNIVIAGSWLPYDCLKKENIQFIEVATVEAIADVLPEIVENYETYKKKYKQNRVPVYKISSWENCIRDWYSVYDSVKKC